MGWEGAEVLITRESCLHHTTMETMANQNKAILSKKQSTPAGLEPTRDKPNRFLVDRLNHSATVSVTIQHELVFTKAAFYYVKP